MVSRDDGKLVLWPIYFDRSEPRPWRRVPKELAVDDPTAEAIARVAAELRLKPVLEKGVSHPRRWWLNEGRVLIDVRGAKSVLLQQIAERLKSSAPAKVLKGPAAKK